MSPVIPKVKRKYHHWEEWECYKNGFFDTFPPEGMTKEDAETEYCIFLSNLDRFSDGMERVFREWPNSCEQFLTNPTMNRIAWLGQSAMCIETGVPACFRGGFKLLSQESQDKANKLAKEYLIRWLNEYNKKTSI